ncbi:hypothetical protein WJX74_009568 [Apatococcus lobatus]|uniref:Poly [ADP-ribose] polymerase n=1 Tax=Apatococcus lobatus TaxID=904363 RepID=A0AAW1SD05_9CHLO
MAGQQMQPDHDTTRPTKPSIAAVEAPSPTSMSIIDLQKQNVSLVDLTADSEQPKQSQHSNVGAGPASHATPVRKRRRHAIIDLTDGRDQAADSVQSSHQPDQHSAQCLVSRQHRQCASDWEIAMSLQAQQDQIMHSASSLQKNSHKAALDHGNFELLYEKQHQSGKKAHDIPGNAELRQRNALLMQKLEELQGQARQSASGDAQRQLPLDFPAFWSDLGPEEAAAANSVQLVKLPLPGQQGIQDLPPSLDPWIFFQLVEQGFAPQDAVAALLACDGHSGRAQILALEQQAAGGTAACKHGNNEDMLRKLSIWAGQAEAQIVLQHFTKSGMKDEQVKCIERVQNKVLWRRFALRRNELQQKHGYSGSNDLKLFHGAGKHALEAIINEGFDIRVANAGSLGQGTYFAQKSTYSTQFSQKPHQAALKAAEVRRLQQQQSQGQAGRPAFLIDGFAMLLCPVALGKVVRGSPDLRRPPPGFDSVCRRPDLQHNDIFAVFDNNQSYPEYIIHYR